MKSTAHPSEMPRLRAVPHLKDMTFSEQLCLWSVRFWADFFRRGKHPQQLLRDAYKLAGAPRAMADMDGFMSVLVSGLQAPIDIRCVHCPGISEEEFLIMEALALCQRDQIGLAETALESLIQPAALRIAMPMIQSWSDAMKQAGHAVPFRDWIPAISDPASQTTETSLAKSEASHRQSLH
ncbi:hypothetical protein [Aestuariispira insulae]|uniref:Uncharacterized protein n=1 Tax=Aestuariispira insulae TaxID=1461337 RepID=A0A3D9HEV5_9PROT|nr:hypothetical protein [Aestuariispira insulae]RED48003.1 hypothetical protein DFP90_10820 [Aestuariispira insulae]